MSERTPPRKCLTIDPRREGVCFDLGVEKIHLRFRRHGKNGLTIEHERETGVVVVIKTKKPCEPE